MGKLKEEGSQKILTNSTISALEKYRLVVEGKQSWWYFLKFEIVVSLLISWPGAMGLWLRRTFYRGLFRQCGSGVLFGRNVVLRHPRRISLGNNVIINDDVTLDAKGTEGEGITIGDDVFIGKGTVLSMLDGTIEIDDGASIGFYCRIGSTTHTKIGKKALIAGYVYIVGADHDSSRIDIPIIDQPTLSRGGVTVGDGTWLGTKATVLDGTAIGRDCIVGAHSLVTTDIPDFSVAVGIPAKITRNRKDSSAPAE